MITIYDNAFYDSRNQETAYSANKVLNVLFQHYKPDSMVDFGCGVGTWLNEASKLGVSKIFGLEGNWLNTSHLVIPGDSFRHSDLSQGVELNDRFDLAISLEVAEHISGNCADQFVDNLTNAADVVMFSAAIPGQRGSGHVNEQWPEYWISKFEKKGYFVMDIVRPRVWNDSKIKGWYKQNILVFAKRDRLHDFPGLAAAYDPDNTMYNVVHPDTYLRQIELSHPKYASYCKVITSLPGLTIRAFVRNTRKAFKKLGA